MSEYTYLGFNLLSYAPVSRRNNNKVRHQAQHADLHILFPSHNNLWNCAHSNDISTIIPQKPSLSWCFVRRPRYIGICSFLNSLWVYLALFELVRIAWIVGW